MHDPASADSDRRAAELRRAWAEHRPHLVDLAFRMLGNIADAEDITQEAFIRMLAAETADIDEPRAWLTVVVSRLCIDQLRSAHNRREHPKGSSDDDLHTAPAATLPDPADRVTLDASISMALLIVLERLTPAERAAFVLHDLFQFSFDDIGDILGRSPAACRQLATRARKHVTDDTSPARFQVDDAEQRRVSEGFIAACATGDLNVILSVLHVDAAGQLELDDNTAAVVRTGRHDVATGLATFFGPSSGTTLVPQTLNGEPGVLAFRHGELVGMLVLRVRDGLIDHIHAIASRHKLALVSSQLAPPDHNRP
jgi:RNA polymerase sigma-70 factor (ECF subfamily)